MMETLPHVRRGVWPGHSKVNHLSPAVFRKKHRKPKGDQPETSRVLLHGPQVTIQPSQGFLNELISRHEVTAVVDDPFLVVRWRPEELEHGFLRGLDGEVM